MPAEPPKDYQSFAFRHKMHFRMPEPDDVAADQNDDWGFTQGCAESPVVHADVVSRGTGWKSRVNSGLKDLEKTLPGQHLQN